MPPAERPSGATQESAWHLVGGADASRAGGTSTDHLVPTGLRIGGGVQWQEGVFGQADRAVGPARFFAGLRENFTGSTRFLSPSAGLAAGRKRLRGRAAVYRAFRAPTLNELYREFRVGNTDTLANPNLRPETVFGAETGVDWIGESTAFRVTAYRNSLDNLITNVTLSSAANSILRQRENAAAAVSRGVEADLRGHYRHWTGQLEYLFADSRYSTGPRIAEVPRHQGSALIAWQRGGTLASAALRSYAYQFDDDLNQYRLPGYTVLRVLRACRGWRHRFRPRSRSRMPWIAPSTPPSLPRPISACRACGTWGCAGAGESARLGSALGRAGAVCRSANSLTSTAWPRSARCAAGWWPSRCRKWPGP